MSCTSFSYVLLRLKGYTNPGQAAPQIGAKTPDPALLGTEYNGDYSFDSRSPGEHDYTIKFQNLTLMSG